MKKVFNINKVDELIINLQPYYFLSEENVYKGQAIKILRDFIKTNHAITNINTILSDEDFNNLIKKFFPLKYASLEGTDFKTKSIYYSNEDLKIHWIIVINGEKRHFKLKTNEIYSRLEGYVVPWFNNFKKEMDRLYGYWLEQTDDYWFVTDMNKNKNDSYRILATNNNNLSIKNSSFGSIRNIEDLHIEE